MSDETVDPSIKYDARGLPYRDLYPNQPIPPAVQVLRDIFDGVTPMAEPEPTPTIRAFNEDAARDALDYLKLVDAYLFSTDAPEAIWLHTLNA